MTDLRKKTPLTDYSTPWESDVFDRKEVAIYLTSAISSICQPFVISLSSGYGTGKTFFIRNWESHLKQDGYHCVYFNAWEEDYTNDPFIAFMSTLKKQLSGEGKKTEKKIITTLREGSAFFDSNSFSRFA